MRIDKFLAGNKEKFCFSLEVTPPDRGRSVAEVFETIDVLRKFEPKFINVTYHQPHVSYKVENGVKVRDVYRKKPGTVGICAAIQNRYGIDAVPHLLCGGMDKWEIEDTLIDLHYLGFDNVFALRGDPAFGMDRFTPKEDGYSHADELVAHISNMNKGIYLDSDLTCGCPTDFCIGVAGYPETHREAISPEDDLLNLKKKIDAGASFIVTQMCFDANIYADFINKIRNLGIDVPVIPGIRPFTSLKQVEMVENLFGVSVSSDLKKAMADTKSKSEEFEAGTAFTVRLCRGLLEKGAPGIHLFTMGKGRSAAAVLEQLS